MRNLTDHIVEGDSANHQLTITVLDEPGSGGANHEYSITWDRTTAAGPVGDECNFSFQNGPIKEHGLNGITQEALLAIVIDRLRGFQAGQFACDQNQGALESCQDALFALQERTRLRLARGVEGTHAV